MEYGDTAQWAFVIMTSVVMVVAIIVGLFTGYIAVTKRNDLVGRIVAGAFTLCLVLGPMPWFVILAGEVL